MRQLERARRRQTNNAGVEGSRKTRGHRHECEMGAGRHVDTSLQTMLIKEIDNNQYRAGPEWPVLATTKRKPRELRVCETRDHGIWWMVMVMMGGFQNIYVLMYVLYVYECMCNMCMYVCMCTYVVCMYVYVCVPM